MSEAVWLGLYIISSIYIAPIHMTVSAYAVPVPCQKIVYFCIFLSVYVNVFFSEMVAVYSLLSHQLPCIITVLVC